MSARIAPLLGSDRGAFQFFGLFNREAVSDSASDSSDKDLYQVGADPVAPFDYNRTYMTLTNQSYRITETDNQFTITPLARYLQTSQPAVPPARPWHLEDGAEEQGE